MNNEAINEIVKSVVQKIKDEEMTLQKARQIAYAVEKKAEEIGVNAVVAIADKSGHPILVESMENAYIASYDIAVNKAFTVTSLKMSTSQLKPLAQPGGELYGIQFTNNGKIVIFGGGEPLIKNGSVIGGLGVSGGSEAEDTELGRFGREYFENNI